MAKATKLKSGNWRCKANYKDEKGNHVNKSFTAETKKEAEFMAAQFLVERKHKQKPVNKTIGELATEYLDSRSNLLSPSTLRSYRVLRRTAFPALMETRAGMVTQKMYQAHINEYADGRSPKTVMEAHRLMCRVFQENKIDVDTKSIILPPKVKTEISIPTTDEVKQILEASKAKGIYFPVLLAALLGLRRSEIFALTWGDIDAENNRIRINKAIVKNTDCRYVVKATKTQSSTRSLYMPPQIAEALPERKADGERVFDVFPDAFSNRFRKMINGLKLKHNYNFHALRHYCASAMLKNNIPDKYAMERMGHIQTIC
jgi:integrase